MSISGRLERSPAQTSLASGTQAHNRRAFVLDPRADGVAARLGNRLSGHRPWVASAIAFIAGYVFLAAATVGLGLLLTRALLPIDALEDADQYLPEFFSDNRSEDANDASYVASMTGDIPVLPALGVMACIVAAFFRRWIVTGFLIVAVALEVTIYRIGAMVVGRDRPDVARLEDLPVDHSFPSGHVAASTVVYAGIALLVVSIARGRGVVAACWAVAAIAVISIAVSRIYRGMHHPLDTVSGVLLGAGCLLVALTVVRIYGHVRDARADRVETRTNKEVSPA
jgi:membrane-associated phospholipid phosphatase